MCEIQIALLAPLISESMFALDQISPVPKNGATLWQLNMAGWYLWLIYFDDFPSERNLWSSCVLGLDYQYCSVVAVASCSYSCVRTTNTIYIYIYIQYIYKIHNYIYTYIYIYFT